jgi:hypothetical protein
MLEEELGRPHNTSVLTQHEQQRDMFPLQQPPPYQSTHPEPVVQECIRPQEPARGTRKNIASRAKSRKV